MDLISLTEAAQRLGVTRERVRQLVLAKRIPAERIGHQWAVSAQAVEDRRSQRAGEAQEPKNP